MEIKRRHILLVVGILMVVVGLLIPAWYPRYVYLGGWTHVHEGLPWQVYNREGVILPSCMVQDIRGTRSWVYLYFDLSGIQEPDDVSLEICGRKEAIGRGASDKLVIFPTASFDITRINWHNRPSPETIIPLTSSEEKRFVHKGIETTKFVFTGRWFIEHVKEKMGQRVYFLIRGDRDGEGTHTDFTRWTLVSPTVFTKEDEPIIPKLVLWYISGGLVLLKWLMLIAGAILIIVAILRIIKVIRIGRLVILPVLLAFIVVWQIGFSILPMGTVQAIYAVSTVGGPLNLLFGGWYVYIPMAAFFLLIWGIAVAIMTLRNGDWSLFIEHFLWGLGVFLGFLAFIIPGIILLIFMWKRFGTKATLLILLGPIGSALVATVPTLVPPVRPPVWFEGEKI